MSSDLLAAFNSESQAPSDAGTVNYGTPQDGGFENAWSQSKNSQSYGQQPIESTQVQAHDEDDDDFGDFEDASAAIPSATNSVPASSSREPVTSFPPKAPNRSGQQPRPPSQDYLKAKQEQRENVGSHPFAGRMDLLFEAGDDDYDAGADELGDLSNNPEAAMAYSKRIIAEQQTTKIRDQPSARASNAFASNAVSSRLSAVKPDSKAQSGSGRNKLKKKSGYTPAAEPEVLFDAEDVTDADDEFGDFGEFESEMQSATTLKTKESQLRTPIPAIDLLGLEDNDSNEVETTARTLSSRGPGEPYTTKNPPAPSPRHLEPEDDAWDDFETAAPSSPTSSVPPTKPTSPPAAIKPSKSPSTEPNALPPTNVPPPVILLSIFPSFFASADDALFDAMGKLDLKQRQMLLAHPASHQFLRGYLSHSVVLARIIAGRKLRWKRDQRLSQSMRIGPAAAGGKGGMKLTGLDKSEVQKEDREVVEVLRLWKNQVGRLRTAVTAASTAPGLPKLPAVPEIAEQMPVKTLKPAEGGVTAPAACALCGLRREERVAKVDVGVEDSFGEWWVQGMNMHLGCKQFWEEFEGKLKSR